MRWLFVYGTLMPGRLRWPLIADDVVRQRPSAVPGTLYDTGLGYPAFVVGGDHRVPGWLLGLSERASTVFEQLEFVLRKIGDEASFRVGDGHRDRDYFDAGLESLSGCLRQHPARAGEHAERQQGLTPSQHDAGAVERDMWWLKSLE